MKNSKAFSLLEISVVILIVGILIAGVSQGNLLVQKSRIASAKSLTKGAPILAMEDLSMWLEPTLEESFNKDEAKNGYAITNWYDINPQVGTKNSASSNGTSRPTYKSDCLNRLPCVSFNGSSNYLATDNSTRNRASELTIFVVASFNKNSFTNSDSAMISAIIDNWGGDTIDVWGDGNYGAFALRTRGSSLFYQLPGDYGEIDSNSLNTSGAYIFTITDSNTFQSLYVNGYLHKSTSVVAPSDFYRNLNFNIGAFSRTIPIVFYDFFNGGICEIIIFGRELPEKERSAVEEYLFKKWAINHNTQNF